MIRFVLLLALTGCQVSTATEVLSAAIAPAVITSRSSQYFAQNHNSLAAPVVPAAPIAARIEAVPAPVAPVTPVAAPITQYFIPSSASVSHFTRYAQYVAAPAIAQYVASAPIVAQTAPLLRTPVAAPAQLLASPVVSKAAPLLASPITAPLVARPPVAVAQRPVAPQQPAPNPDSETVEIESARIRSSAQARNQSQPQVQQNFARFQPQLGQEQGQLRAQPAARGQQQQQQQQRSAAPGLLSSQQYIQGPYLP